MRTISETPWKAEEVGTRMLEDHSESPVFEIRNDSGDLIAENVDAWDAPIIAAAPKLLAALDKLLYTPGNGVTPEAHPDAVAAIKEALGE